MRSRDPSIERRRRAGPALLAVVAGVLAWPAASDGRLAAGARARVGPFAPLIREVMGTLRLRRLRLTGVPLQAPSGRLAPLSVEGAGGVGGWFQADNDTYTVHVGWCADLRPPPRVYVAVAPRRRCDQTAAAIARGFSYGARRYRSRSAALAALTLPRPGGRAVQVALGDGVLAREYRRGGGLIDWTQARWRVRVDYSSCPVSGAGGASNLSTLTLPDVRRIVAFIHVHGLPAAPGRALFSGSCGDPSSGQGELEWARGRDVYRARTYGYDPLPVLRLAQAMRSYR